MRRIVVREFTAIPRAELHPRQLAQLQRLDAEQTIFDWSGMHSIKALNYVGVVHVPGVTIEILPKLAEGEQSAELAQRNLIHMLAVAGELPFEDRHLAHQQLEALPLLEVLVGVFARALVRELRRGVTRAYVHREENLTFVKGSLMHAQNARLNHVRRDRNYVRYDDFLSDTLLNQILRATCRRLQTLPLRQRTQMALHVAGLELAEVSDVLVSLEMFERLKLDRNTQRFASLLEFCRMVWLRQTAIPTADGMATFSLLFPMEQVFEQFVGELIRRHAEPGARVCLQSAGASRCLLQTENGSGRFRLRPDVLIRGPAGDNRTILDTKWKRLKAGVEDRRGGVAQADLYQLYAYANRFRSPDNILLYPAVPGVAAKRYRLFDEPGRRVRVEFLDLSRDLRQHHQLLVEELLGLLRPAD